MERKNLQLPKLMARDDAPIPKVGDLPPPPPVEPQHYLAGVGDDMQYLMTEEGLPFEEALEDALRS